MDLAVTDTTLSITPRPSEGNSAQAEPRRDSPSGRRTGLNRTGVLSASELLLALRLDGKSVTRTVAGREVEFKARWQESAIWIERKIKDGPKAVGTWAVDETGSRLVVTRTLELPQRPKVELRRVYRRPASGTT